MTEPINLDAASPSEIERLVLAHANAKSGWNIGWSWWRDDAGEVEEITDLGTVVAMEKEGGSEGDGERMSIVIKVTQGEVERYFKKTGYYSSYGGTEWDGKICSVWPTRKMVTVYE